MTDNAIPQPDPALADALAQPLPDALVRHRPDGRGGSLAYISAATAIAQANRHFGPAGWSYRVAALAPIEGVGWSATVRVNALGVEREDVGVGMARGRGDDAAETAIKGAVSDALKRALRTFGPQFGLALYDGAAFPHAREGAQARQREAAPTRQRESAQARAGGGRTYETAAGEPIPHHFAPDGAPVYEWPAGEAPAADAPAGAPEPPPYASARPVDMGAGATAKVPAYCECSCQSWRDYSASYEGSTCGCDCGCRRPEGAIGLRERATGRGWEWHVARPAPVGAA